MRIALTLLVLSAGAVIAQTPASIDAPGDRTTLRMAARGVQIYECRATASGEAAWAFKEPRADLFVDGRPAGHHFAGPTWEHTDGSRIVGKVASAQPAPATGAIPWLRLAVVSHAGTGVLSPVSIVKRIDTVGGTLAGPCPTPGAIIEVPYTADYVMGRDAP